MAERVDIGQRLTDAGLIAVLRLGRRELLAPVGEALVAGGVTALEVTLTMPDALGALREAVQRWGGVAVVGAGSVLGVADARAALEAGARFLVSPICRPELVAPARAAGVPLMLGALTPTEAQTAHEAGADFIKIFPAEVGGPAFCRALLGPLPHLRLVPTGGVDLRTLPEFFRAGCVAVGAGSPLVRPELIAGADWAGLQTLAREWVQAVRAARVSGQSAGRQK
jgi:2-dehydro-3-deoxyphosphogluconate aldolase/(4S)-4-hydroxy-2-oxoglutarate aldolase